MGGELRVRSSLVGREDSILAEVGRSSVDDWRLDLWLWILLRSLFKRSPCLDFDGFISFDGRALVLEIDIVGYVV